MDNQIAISIQNVSKSFNKTLSLKSLLKIISGNNLNNDLILSDISIDIYKGDFVAIVGNNGVGKSTLLKLISGVLSPDSGSIYTNGTINAIHELTSGFNQELNGYENLQLLGTLHGIPENEFSQKLNEVVSFSELSESSLNKPIKYYSSGMKTRLAYAFNITFVKDILLLDEVLAVGDYNFIQKCIAQLEILKQKGVTIVLVTHNITRVQNLISKVFEITNSKVLFTSLETYLEKRNKNNEDSFFIHPNLSIDSFIIIEKKKKTSLFEKDTKSTSPNNFKLDDNQNIEIKYNILNNTNPVNVKFYGLICAENDIVKYESEKYNLKNGKNEVSFNITLPGLIKGIYTLQFYIFDINSKQILLKINTIQLNGTSEFTISTALSVAQQNLKLNITN
ncbi:ABC transporter domain-containing protein [Tenacibaculum sp. 190130A14a]|uniref:ABC transporter domain-containing protein n=1 Tax=Tenacibaculum polynesiense TaxID=3137857 RepID=A0ABP1EZF4_9FLAO